MIQQPRNVASLTLRSGLRQCGTFLINRTVPGAFHSTLLPSTALGTGRTALRQAQGPESNRGMSESRTVPPAIHRLPLQGKRGSHGMLFMPPFDRLRAVSESRMVGTFYVCSGRKSSRPKTHGQKPTAQKACRGYRSFSFLSLHLRLRDRRCGTSCFGSGQGDFPREVGFPLGEKLPVRRPSKRTGVPRAFPPGPPRE